MNTKIKRKKEDIEKENKENLFKKRWNKICEENWVFYFYDVIRCQTAVLSNPSNNGKILFISSY